MSKCSAPIKRKILQQCVKYRTQPAFTCLNLKIKTLEQGVKYV